MDQKYLLKKLSKQQTFLVAKGLNYNTTDTNNPDFIVDHESSLKNTKLTDDTKIISASS